MAADGTAKGAVPTAELTADTNKPQPLLAEATSALETADQTQKELSDFVEQALATTTSTFADSLTKLTPRQLALLPDVIEGKIEDAQRQSIKGWVLEKIGLVASKNPIIPLKWLAAPAAGRKERTEDLKKLLEEARSAKATLKE